MTHFERFYATIERRPVDRPASWLGLPHPDAYAALYAHFKVDTLDELRNVLDDDMYPVELPYHSPTSNAIYAAFDFALKTSGSDDERTLTSPGFFQDYDDPALIDDFDWPDPCTYVNPKECRTVVDDAPDDKPVMGIIWSAHFQDACAAFGMEMALMKMKVAPEMFHAVINRICDFYLAANEIFYRATKGKLHAVLIGNDMGSQTGLMVSADDIRTFLLPGTRKLVAQAKAHGLKVIHHSCGAIFDIIPDLIEAGVDVIHPIQALAAGMDPLHLKTAFGSRISFCGGIDAQNLLINGTPAQVHQKVLDMKRIFPTGLIISPSHEAILPDIAPANLEALFRAVAHRGH